MYDHTYDEKHRAITVTSIKGEKEKYIQKGLREHLLCGACETQLSIYEGYSSRIIKSVPSFPRDRTGNFLITPKVDYKKFKLFQMSILWRASIANGPWFASVNLGNQEERLRKMIYEGKPGMSHNFGCVMYVAPNADRLKQIIWSPVKDVVEGKFVYRFQTGNLFWFFFITSFPKQHSMRSWFLSEDGNLPILIAQMNEEEIIQRIAGLFAEKYSKED